MTPDQINVIVSLCPQVALYDANANIAERRHEYNHAEELRSEMLRTIGYLRTYIEAQSTPSPVQPGRRA